MMNGDRFNMVKSPYRKRTASTTKTNKYKNNKTVTDGITFDSKLESDYYLILKDQLKKKEIKDFSVQPRFVLLNGFTKNGKKYRDCSYIGDFAITRLDGSISIVDVKGWIITPEFSIKHRWFENNFPDLTLSILKRCKCKRWFVSPTYIQKCCEGCRIIKKKGALT